MPASRRWDIFGKVVDNFGDAGVAWRLARQLAAEHALDVTLWLDDIAALARMAPGVDPARDVQVVAGITLRRWGVADAAGEPAEVVVEAFGCKLPDRYLAAMAARPAPPAWIVLEYLSAEAWVEGTHDVVSPHPTLPLRHRYFFPGFTPGTGGLLRERGLIEAREAFRHDAALRLALWSRLGVTPPDAAETRISLFCYPSAPLAPLLDAWADGDTAVSCLVPDGVAAGALDAWTRGDMPHPGHPIRRGRLTLHAIPFVAQDEYDRVLWASDVNFVRGEDSFVRAQWAAQPFAWHIYPQADAAHRRKLDAFIERYAADLDVGAAAAVRGFWRAWNRGAGAGPIAEAWLEFALARPHLERHGHAWARKLATLPDLAGSLVRAACDQV